MAEPMTSFDEPAELRAVDATFHYGGILLRAFGYLTVWAIAKEYDFGMAFLTGVLAGDLLGQLVRIGLHFREAPLYELGELMMIGLVYLFARPLLAWPDDQAMRAIVGLAAFGALSGHAGGTMLALLPRPAD